MFGVILNTKNIISLNNMVLTINKIFNRNKLDIFLLEKKTILLFYIVKNLTV